MDLQPAADPYNVVFKMIHVTMTHVWTKHGMPSYMSS